jgi:hypothetical protein
MADKAVIADRHQLADEGVRLNLAASADDSVLLDFDEWADEAVVTDRAAVQVGGLDHRYSFSKVNSHDSTLPQSWVTHGVVRVGIATV